MPSEMELLAKISNSGLSQGEKEELRRRMIKEGMTEEFIQAVEDACGKIQSTRYTARPVENVFVPAPEKTPEVISETLPESAPETFFEPVLQPASEPVPEPLFEAASEPVSRPVVESVFEPAPEPIPASAPAAAPEKQAPSAKASPSDAKQNPGSPLLVLIVLVGSALLLGYALWVQGILTF